MGSGFAGSLITGTLAGAGIGYVLQRSDLCFHSAFRGVLERRYSLARAWLVGVVIASVGLTVIYELSAWSQLNRGLPFRPVQNVLGGLMIGAGMVVAASCTSGLFYKLGSGMFGALVGLMGWSVGEIVAVRIEVPGPTVLGGGEAGTIPGALGIPRPAFVAALVVLVALVLPWGRRLEHRTRWNWKLAGVMLGLVTTAGWVLAGVGGHDFGPSSVGAVAGFVDGDRPWWLASFLAAIVVGAAVASRRSGTWWPRWEDAARYRQLAIGGWLLGAGGVVGGGCNLGHGLSGAAQLNVSSWVVVAAIFAGIWGTKELQQRIARWTSPSRWTPLEAGTESGWVESTSALAAGP